MPQINFNKLFDIVVNWFKKPETVESTTMHFLIEDPRSAVIFDGPIDIVKGVTQVDQALLAEYSNNPNWKERK